MPRVVRVARISSDVVAPSHEVTRQLQAQLEQWEEAVLPEAERVLLRHKWRGMGMVQHKAKQVSETWEAALSRLQREMLDEAPDKLPRTTGGSHAVAVGGRQQIYIWPST